MEGNRDIPLFYALYLGLLHYGAIRSRAAGSFDEANLYAEIAYQLENGNYISDLRLLTGMQSLEHHAHDLYQRIPIP
jgi:hypothetical protein